MVSGILNVAAELFSSTSTPPLTFSLPAMVRLPLALNSPEPEAQTAEAASLRIALERACQLFKLGFAATRRRIAASACSLAKVESLDGTSLHFEGSLGMQRIGQLDETVRLGIEPQAGRQFPFGRQIRAEDGQQFCCIHVLQVEVA
ncbi:MAG: hypothetical protein M5R42_14190 [Rhodocyclaceae bacterium]|nr:hypothetical protein [Rhodocyclaceae bacterium]